VFEPTYALHSHIASITATEVVVGDRRADFTIDPDAAVELVASAQPTLVFVCSPNNPTGTVEPFATIERLLAATGGLVIVDEAYGEFAPRSALELVRDDDRLVVVRTYSKVWSMAALRLGYAVAPEWVVEELDKVVLPYHLDVATQLAGRLALDLAEEMGERVGRLVAERERVVAELDRVAGIEVYPSGANFVLLRVLGDGHALWQRMVDRGVLVRDFSRWPLLAECLRVSIGTPEENDAFLGALRASLAELLEGAP
jgi:histidinol-phosphate aminotransferase